MDNINELFGYEDENGNIVEGTTELATQDSNNDGIINNQDSIFNQLKIWQDFNQNGITDAGELNSLSAHNITSINLTTTPINHNINGFFRKENANSVFRKNEHQPQADLGRKSSSNQNAVLMQKSDEALLKPVNENFINQNLSFKKILKF